MSTSNLNTIDDLIFHLIDSVPGIMITGQDKKEDRRFNISVAVRNPFGFTYYIKTAEANWSSGNIIFHFLNPNSKVTKEITDALELFNPKK